MLQLSFMLSVGYFCGCVVGLPLSYVMDYMINKKFVSVGTARKIAQSLQNVSGIGLIVLGSLTSPSKRTIEISLVVSLLLSGAALSGYMVMLNQFLSSKD